MSWSTPSATGVGPFEIVTADVETDLIIIPVFEGESLAAAVPGLSEATAGAMNRALASREVQGKPYRAVLDAGGQGLAQHARGADRCRS